MRRFLSERIGLLLTLVLYTLSLPIKWVAATWMPFDFDTVPVLARGADWLAGGTFPAVGTLSSVAAYNFPALPWLHIPAQLFTEDAFFVILSTMLVFNLIATLAMYGMGRVLGGPAVGILAAALFTFGETGVSSAYTAWAQLLLPGFYALTLLCLFLWITQERGVYLAWSGVLATLAIMTHFSAILLLPAMFLVALLADVRWPPGWLLGGTALCLALLAPYLIFDAEQDFANLRAFLAQEVRVDPTMMDLYGQWKPGSEAVPPAEPIIRHDKGVGSTLLVAQPTTEPRLASIAEQLLQELQTVPQKMLAGTIVPFQVGWQAVPSWVMPLRWLPFVLYAVGVLEIIRRTFRAMLQVARRKLPLREIPARLRETPAGRALLVLLFHLVLLAGLVITGNSTQRTYFIGLLAPQLLIAGYAGWRLLHLRGLRVVVIMGVVLFAGINAVERVGRVVQHDYSTPTLFNASIYRHVSAVADAIAADWQGDADALVVSYDLLPEMRVFWWVPAWHSVDDGYRMGMHVDFLLHFEHGLRNLNRDPVGEVVPFDYLVVTAEGFERYADRPVMVLHEGPLMVLQPSPDAVAQSSVECTKRMEAESRVQDACAY